MSRLNLFVTGGGSGGSGGGSITWDGIQSALGNLALNNAGFTTTFNQTSAVAWSWANTTVATVSTANASPLLEVAANYWNGSSSAASVWTLGSSLAAGTNAAETVALTRLVGNPGTPTFAFQTQAQTAPNSLVQSINGYPPTGNGTAATSIFGSNNTAGNLLVVFACWATAGLTATIADSIGNAWTTPGARQNNGTAFSQVWYCLNCKGGANTVTVSYAGGTATFFAQSAAEFTGVDTFEQLVENGTSSQVLTTSHNASQLVIGCTNGSNGTYGAATGSDTYFLPVSGRCVMDFWPNAGLAMYTQSSTGSATGATGHILSFYKSAGLATVNQPIMTVTPTALTMFNQTLASAASALSSPAVTLSTQYWTGAASAADTWTIGSSLAAGTNGASTLTITHAGSTGAAVVKAPAFTPTVAAPASGGFGLYGANQNLSLVGNASSTFALVVYSGGGVTALFGIGNTGSANADTRISGMVSGWTSSATNPNCTLIDTGISRLGAASLAIGNGSASDTTGNLSFGKVIKYNGIATVSGGVPSELAVSDLTTQSAAITATTLYATTATGMYRVSWSATITTAGTTSVLGGTNGFQVLYTSPTDSVVKTTVPGNSVTSAANTTGTAVGGCEVVYAKTGTNIQFTYDYTSTGTSMVYELHIKVEAL